MLRFCLLAFSLLLIPAAAPAQELHTLILKKADKGSSSQVQVSDSGTEKLKMTDVGGEILMDHVEKQHKKYTYVETVLERPDLRKQATMPKRQYEKATVMVDDNESALVYHGKTVIIEKKDGTYRFRIENGEEITGDDAQYLDEEFNKGTEDDLIALIVPQKAVAINEAWKVSMTEFLKIIEKAASISGDHDKASGTGKLVKAYKKDGRQYGDIVVAIELPVKNVHSEVGDIICEPGAILNLELKQTTCIDGSLEHAETRWTMHFDAKSVFPSADNVQAHIDLSVRSVVTDSSIELPKK